jgi:hypothetical protein
MIAPCSFHPNIPTALPQPTLPHCRAAGGSIQPKHGAQQQRPVPQTAGAAAGGGRRVAARALHGKPGAIRVAIRAPQPQPGAGGRYHGPAAAPGGGGGAVCQHLGEQRDGSSAGQWRYDATHAGPLGQHASAARQRCKCTVVGHLSASLDRALAALGSGTCWASPCNPSGNSRSGPKYPAQLTQHPPSRLASSE